MRYEKHIFVCVHERDPEEQRKFCGEAKGLQIVEAFKVGIKSRKLNVKMRAQKTGCFDMCAYGTTVAVYPEGVFYKHIEVSDVEEIIESHLVNNVPVERLKIRENKNNND